MQILMLALVSALWLWAVRQRRPPPKNVVRLDDYRPRLRTTARRR